MDKAEKIDISDRCGKTANDFKTEHIFKMHMRDNIGHTNESFSCCHCGKSFQSKKLLNYHEKITHKEDSLYKCDECHKAFKHKYHLKSHKSIHEEAMGVSCRFCRKSFKTFKNDNFKRHLAICQGKKFRVTLVMAVLFCITYTIYLSTRSFFELTINGSIIIRTHFGMSPPRCDVCGTAIM